MQANIIQYLIEPFLIQYFLIDAIASDYMTAEERHNIYGELSDLFCVSGEKESIDSYFELSEKEPYSSIKDFAGYERLCRSIEFAEKTGQNVGISEKDRVILSQKREALLRKHEIFQQGKNLTRELISTTLMQTARNGNLNSMLTLAFMEYHGICLCPDRETAVKRLRLCAKWNNLFGNLMGISYDPGNKSRCYDTLFTVYNGLTQKQLVEHIAKTKGYTQALKTDPVAKLFEKAFGLNIVKRSIYDQSFAKVAFSELITTEDKKRLLLNRQTNAAAMLSDIPFDAKDKPNAVFDSSCTDSLVLKRPDELHMIMRNLSTAEKCPMCAYKPLLIISEDEYVTDMYRNMISDGFSREYVAELDAENLTSQDFSQNSDNAFLRGIAETGISDTVFLINHCEGLDDSSLDELKKMLDYNYRKKFRLSRPAISLDISGLLPVLFACADNGAVRSLYDCCDVVRAAQIGNDEKNTVINCLFTSGLKRFGCENITLERDCLQVLNGFDGFQIMQITDSVIRTAIYENSGTITPQAIKTALKELNIDRTKREFGFLGGTNA